MSQSAFADELDAAREACRRATRILLRHYSDRRDEASLKDDGTPVTPADREADEAIVSVLRERFPHDAIWSEESVDARALPPGSRVWIVDPLDGTRDFVARTGDFAVHVALVREGAPVLAVCGEPIGNALYHAVAGEGAFVTTGGETRRLRVSDRDRLTQFRVGVSRFSVSPDLRRLLEGSPLGGGAVPIGASIKMLALARGDLDATICLDDEQMVWDTAAPGLVVTEAGGVVSDARGEPLHYAVTDPRHPRGVLMSNGRAHPELVALIRRHWRP